MAAEDMGWVTEAMRRDGFAVVPVLSAEECTVLQEAYTRSLNTPGMPDQREGGMVNIFFLPEKEVLVSGNPRVHAALAASYGEPELTIQMHERMNCKLPGNGHQPLHLDVDLFHPFAAFGVRTQALVCFDIDEEAHPDVRGSIAIARRFHHWLAVAQLIFHPDSGVEGLRLDEEFLPVLDTGSVQYMNLKDNAGRSGRYAHRFMAIPPEAFKLGAMSAYIRLAEAFAAHGAEALASLASTCSAASAEVEGVRYQAMAEHIAAQAAAGTPVPLPADETLGDEDLALRPVELRAGEMVLWDSVVPHHNVAASADNRRPRMSAYVDMAPADAGNYAPPEEQVKNQTERLRSSTVGPSDDPNNPDELAHLIPAWESLPLDYRKKYTTDGKYGARPPSHPRRIMPSNWLLAVWLHSTPEGNTTAEGALRV